MTDTVPRVIVIPAKPELTQKAVQRQLRVAAYCRVSTDSEDFHRRTIKRICR